MISRSQHRRKTTRFLTALVAVLVLSLVSKAQSNQQSQYDRGTPPQHAAGVSSIGSYISADIGTVNLGNGSLNFRLPLGNVGGRGFWLPLTLNYSSKIWSARRGQIATTAVTWAQYSDDPTDLTYFVAGGWTIGAAPYLRARGQGITPHDNPPCTDYDWMLVKLTLVLPDKGEIELRDDAKDGSPSSAVLDSNGCRAKDSGRGRRWHATDGSATIFINENNDGVVNGDLAGTVITSDGTRYHFFNQSTPNPIGPADGPRIARCDWVEDRNGNRITISYPDGFHVIYTDQLGRATTVQQDDPTTGGTRLYDPEYPGGDTRGPCHPTRRGRRSTLLQDKVWGHEPELPAGP
jgi:hypothetical protein